jgi:ribosomal protein L30E
MTAGSDGLLAALGLCRRAGRLAIGFDAAAAAAQKGAPMIVVAGDIAARTRRNIELKCQKGTRIVELGRGQRDIEAALGRRFVVAAVCDKSFARLVEKNLGAASDNRCLPGQGK